MAVAFVRRPQLGVGGEGRGGVTRHADLGDDFQLPGGCVADDLLVVGLGVVVAGAAADLGAAAVAGQAGPEVDGDAPSLVVAEVQMPLVDLVKDDPVDVALGLVDGEEVSEYVEHGRTPHAARSAGCP